MNWLKRYIICGLLLMSGYLYAGNVSIQLDQDSVLIGDHIHLYVEAAISSDSETVIFPELKDTAFSFDLIETFPIDTTEHTYSRTYTITQFNPGVYKIDSFPVLYVDSEQIDTQYSNAAYLYVNTVPVDTSLAIKPIKDPLNMPLQFSEAVPYLIGAGALLIIAFLIFLLHRYRKNRFKQPEIKRTPIDHYQWALKRLKELDKKKLWQEDQTKEYYLEMSEIIRRYLEDRFEILALESTTEEIISALDTNETLKQKVRKILTQSDLAKFAKFKPLGDENIQMMKLAVDFVTHTKPKETEIEQ